MADLKPEFDFYLEKQEELVSQYDGKYLIIYRQKVCGAYDSLKSAIDNAITNLNLTAGNFLVQKCSRGNSDYTQTFHSRVQFA